MWLLPWVVDGEALAWPGVKDLWSGEEVVDQCRHPFPWYFRPLTSPHQRAVPLPCDLSSERRDGPYIGRHGVVVENTYERLLQPFPLFGDWPMHSLSKLRIHFREFCPHAVTSRFPLEEEAPATCFSADVGKA